jgi:hypothetical protein
MFLYGLQYHLNLEMINKSINFIEHFLLDFNLLLNNHLTFLLGNH